MIVRVSLTALWICLRDRAPHRLWPAQLTKCDTTGSWGLGADAQSSTSRLVLPPPLRHDRQRAVRQWAL
jgi:hypothetical protein